MLAGANRPLAGIVVLDFGQVYQGPYATLLMAKAGADVINIEPPQGATPRGGPAWRSWPRARTSPSSSAAC
jgi:crotonobetainyl-CoA:carnitine CoA-transferase CaiB-like acyl-CoA transferase